MKKWKLLLLILIVANYFSTINGQKIQNAKNEISSLTKHYINHPLQSNISDFSKKAESILDTISKGYFELKTGKVYSVYHNISGNPFLFETELKGELVYNNTVYNDVNLIYNIYADELICSLKQKNRSFTTILNPALVQSFYISGKTFLNYSMEENDLRGFYELIFQDDSIELIAKWRKTVYLGNASKDAFTDPERELFLLKNGEIFKIKRKKSLLTPFNLSKVPKKNGKKLKLPNLKNASNEELIEIINHFRRNQTN